MLTSPAPTNLPLFPLISLSLSLKNTGKRAPLLFVFFLFRIAKHVGRLGACLLSEQRPRYGLWGLDDSDHPFPFQIRWSVCGGGFSPLMLLLRLVLQYSNRNSNMSLFKLLVFLLFFPDLWLGRRLLLLLLLLLLSLLPSLLLLFLVADWALKGGCGVWWSIHWLAEWFEYCGWD